MKVVAAVFFSTMLLVGCATGLPPDIADPPPNNPTLHDAQSKSEEFVGRAVRWGGTIASVQNKENETWIEVVARNLRRYGQPYESDATQGRFIARVGRFLDPAVYSDGRQITVAGLLEKPVLQPIGEFTYLYPVVNAATVHLWEPQREVIIYEPFPPWYYDPWYGHPYWYRYPPWY